MPIGSFRITVTELPLAGEPEPRMMCGQTAAAAKVAPPTAALRTAERRLIATGPVSGFRRSHCLFIGSYSAFSVIAVREILEECTQWFTIPPEYSTIYHDLPHAARFWSFLLAVDQNLAEETRKKACPSGGRLHSANYLRKPRGTPN